jgi:hypothetical protein
MSFPPGYSKPSLYIVRRDPQWCRVTGKMRYGSAVEARMTLRETHAKAQHGQSNRTEDRAYPCDFCMIDGVQGWHLTSKPYDEAKKRHGE